MHGYAVQPSPVHDVQPGPPGPGHVPSPAATSDDSGAPAYLIWDDFLLDAPRRCLFRNDELITIEPRALSVLLHLIRHRRRAVPWEELRTQVWQDRPEVSKYAILQAVVKARTALGETGRHGRIRTVARIGYRFTGEVNRPEEAAPGPEPQSQIPGPLAILPFEDRTADPRLAWIEFGLMALTVHLLGGTAGGRLLSPQTVLQALEGVQDVSRPGREAAIRGATNATTIVHTRVYLRDAVLRAVITWSSGGASQQLERTATCAAGLARELASALKDRFDFGPAPIDAGLRAASLPMECLARGLEALTRQQWSKAAKLLDLAVELDPGNVAAQVYLLHALSNLGSPLVLWRSRRLLAHARRENDRLTAARVSQHVGRMYLNRLQPERGDVWLSRSLELASQENDLDLVARTLMLQASVRISRIDHRGMAHVLEQMVQVCEASGNRMLPIAGLNMQAIAAMAHGDLDQALVLIEEALRQCRGLRASCFGIDSADNGAWILSRLGRLEEAAMHAEDAYAAARIHRAGPASLEMLSTLYWVRHLARDHRFAVHAAQQPGFESADPEAPHAWRCLGLVALARADAALAAQHLRRAVLAHREAQDGYLEEQALPWFIDALILAGLLDEAESELRVATSARLNTAELRMQALLAQARLARARGHSREALERLDSALAKSASALSRFWACIDSAWLLSEAGDLTGAQQRLRSVPAPLKDHPLAWATRARVHLAAGQSEEALRSQRQCLALLQGPPPPRHLELLALCESPGTPARAVDTAHWPLPSLL
ncbi:winged helix-turn-helix domain-containing protein [Ideonella sp. YS5]|uniref:winged helix-turn-helix domain-containing protein n=1 Tax=Ideonella sp. YS5 TaxID=3453714 RepID=UPI003EEEE86F